MFDPNEYEAEAGGDLMEDAIFVLDDKGDPVTMEVPDDVDDA